jgi:hypothetical protein
MISQSTGNNFQLPKHFSFDRLANQKKLAPETQLKPFTFNFKDNNDNDDDDYKSSKESSSKSKESSSKTSKTSRRKESSSKESSESSKRSSGGSSKTSKRSSKRSSSSSGGSRSSSGGSSETSKRSSSSSSGGSRSSDDHRRRERRRDDHRHRRKSKDSHSLVSREFKDEFDVQMNDLHEKPLTEDEYRAKQIDLIITLEHLKESGAPVDPRVKLSVDTPLRELQNAHDFAIAHVIRRAKFEQFQQSLTFGTTLLEQGNNLLKNKTGYGAELDGFASHIMMNMPKFNRPLYRLACKYSKITDESSPEMELGRSLLYTACMFHLAKKTSMDPQMMMEFLDFSSNTNANPNVIPNANPNPNTNANTNANTNPTQFPFMTSSPMGMRPNMPMNTRVVSSRGGDNDNDNDDVSISESTESISV